MSDFNAIREYLVKLGFQIDDVGLRRFDDTLRRAGLAVGRIAKNMEVDFVVAGGAMAAAVAAVTAGTVDMMRNVARSDLQMQLYARKMYLPTQAAKELKMATDALGFSIDEILFGPPELAQRYSQLIKDQTAMFKYLGSDGGERAFRQIRDIEFQFTRMGPAMQIFGMRLTEDIINKLFGGPGALEQKLKGFVDWFESPDGFVRISNHLSNVLAPLLLMIGRLANTVFSPRNVDWVINLAVKGAGGIAMTGDMLNRLLQGNNVFYGPGGLYDPSKGFNENMNTLVPGLFGQQDENAHRSKDDIIALVRKYAQKWGLSEADALGLIDQETGGSFNPKSWGKPTKHGRAIGLGQIMPDNPWAMAAARSGKNLFDPDVNLDLSLGYFKSLLVKHNGDYDAARADYYGRGQAPAGDPTTQQYVDQERARADKWRQSSGGATLHPNSYHITINGVHGSDELKRAVYEGIRDAEAQKAGAMYTHAQAPAA